MIPGTLVVGDDPTELGVEEAAALETLAGLFDALAARCAAAGRPVTLRVPLPEGEVPLGNDLMIRCAPGGHFAAWSQGDPHRGYHH